MSKGNRRNMHRDLTALAAEKVVFLDSGVPGQRRWKKENGRYHMANMTLSRKNILVCSGFIAADLLCPTDSWEACHSLTLAVQLERQKSRSAVRLAEPEYAHLRGERQCSVYKYTRTLNNSILGNFSCPECYQTEKPHVLSTGTFLIPSNTVSEEFLLP